MASSTVPEGFPLLTSSEQAHKPGSRSYIIVILLFLINLLNYMDRFAVSAVLPDIQNFFHIDNTKAGLLHTGFVIVYMLVSPLFGYLGDRYSRKWLMVIGVLLWSGVVLAGSFVSRDQFMLFVLSRMCAGIGEASYSTTVPSLIADMFTKRQRSSMLTIFFFGIPIGVGLGYVLAAWMLQTFGSWQWSFRATPLIGLISILLLLIVFQEPKRGAMEGIRDSKAGKWTEDLQHLRQNKSYIAASLAFTATSFVGSGITFWLPTYIMHAWALHGDKFDDTNASSIFGVLNAVGGTIGMFIGSQTAKILRNRGNSRAEPWTCAAGALLAAPTYYTSLLTASTHTTTTWTLVLLGTATISFGYPLSTDIILQVVSPTRRATAQAFQIIVSHLLGGALAPALIGFISDTIANNRTDGVLKDYRSLQYALYICEFIIIVGAGLYLACALSIEDDRRKVENLSKIIILEPRKNGMDTETDRDCEKIIPREVGV